MENNNNNNNEGVQQEMVLVPEEFLDKANKAIMFQSACYLMSIETWEGFSGLKNLIDSMNGG